MPSGSTFLAFGATTIALLLIPGPAVFYLLNRSLGDGRRVGLAAVAGLEVGDAIQAAAAGIGLSAVIATSATAFNVVKWAGVAYLVYLGIKTLRSNPEALDLERVATSTRRAFRQGVLVNALNPKTAMFFLSIFPQFVDPTSATAGRESVVLGGVFVVLATVFNSAYAPVASALRGRLLHGRAVPFVRRYVSGGFYLGLGLLAALGGRTKISATTR